MKITLFLIYYVKIRYVNVLLERFKFNIDVVKKDCPLKIRVVVKRPFGNIEIEGESFDEIVSSLETFPEWLATIDDLVTGPEMVPSETKMMLSGLIEYSQDGALIIVPKDELTNKEAIGLLLYAHDPNTVEPKEVSRLLSLSGRPATGFGSRLSEMRREGLALRDEGGYRLTVLGKKWIDELISRITK